MSTRRPPRKPRGQGPQNSSRPQQQQQQQPAQGQSQSQSQSQYQAGFVTSDYESDIPTHLDPQQQRLTEQTLPDPDRSPPALRTNEEMNLKVLRRYLPGVIAIPRVVNHAHVYFYSSEEQKWETPEVSGSTFLLEVAREAGSEDQAAWQQQESPSSLPPRQCLFLLNRKSLNNIVLDLGLVRNVEFADQILMVTTESHEALMGTYTTSSTDETPGEITFGFYIYENANLYSGTGCPGDTYRQAEVDFIIDRWKLAREARAVELDMEEARREEEERREAVRLQQQMYSGPSQYSQQQHQHAEAGQYGYGSVGATQPEMHHSQPGDTQHRHPHDTSATTAANGPAIQALGRKLSLSALFGGGGGSKSSAP